MDSTTVLSDRYSNSYLTQSIVYTSSKKLQHQTTHEASKLETPDRLISLLPSPADQSSVTLKSVHWYCSDPTVPKQPLSQVRLPPPINVAVAIVFASQNVLPPRVELLRQAIRWVNRTYR